MDIFRINKGSLWQHMEKKQGRCFSVFLFVFVQNFLKATWINSWPKKIIRCNVVVLQKTNNKKWLNLYLLMKIQLSELDGAQFSRRLFLGVMSRDTCWKFPSPAESFATTEYFLVVGNSKCHQFSLKDDYL